MGGAQPLAITMNEGVALIAEVVEWRIDKRIETRYLDEKYVDLDEAIDKALEYKAAGVAKDWCIMRCSKPVGKIAGKEYYSGYFNRSNFGS